MGAVALCGSQREGVPVLEGHTDWIRTLVALPQGGLASGSHDGTIRVWTDDGELLGTINSHGGCVTALDVAPDETLLSGSSDMIVRHWSKDGALQRTFKGHRDVVTAVAAVPQSGGGMVVFSGGKDGSIRVWRSDGTLLKMLAAQSKKITALAVFSDSSGMKIVSGGSSERIQMWSTAAALVDEGIGDSEAVTINSGSVTALSLLPDGRVVYATTPDPNTGELIKVWSPDGQVIGLKGQEFPVTALAALGKGLLVEGHMIQMFVSGSWDRTLCFWRLDDEQRVSGKKMNAYSPINALAVLSDARIASGHDDLLVRIWSPQGNFLDALNCRLCQGPLNVLPSGQENQVKKETKSNQAEEMSRDRQKMRKAFSVWDKDGTGSIDATELTSVMEIVNLAAGGQKVTRLQIAKIAQQAEIAADGTVHFDEFYRLLEELHSERPTASSSSIG